jgi:predicted DNA-binding transcriptional regulator AlpA
MEKAMQTSFQTENRCIRTAEAANYIGLSKSTLEKLRVTGDGPEYAALGRVVVYRVADLDNWVMAHKRRSTSEYRPLVA